MQGKWLLKVLFCLSLLLMIATTSFAARGMWGSKRKSEDEDVDDISNGVGGRFESLNSRAAAMPRKVQNTQQKSDELGSLGELINNIGTPAGMESLEAMLEMYLNMMEELLESPEFDTLITPDTIRTMFDQVPGKSNIHLYL